MKKSIKVVLLLLFVVTFVCGFGMWAGFSPAVHDYRVIHNRDTDDNVLFAFATALQINHPAAYDMIDPSLKPRLDEWMNTHESQRCKKIPLVTQIWPATKYGKKVVIDCPGQDARIRFVVDNIVINDKEVVLWGEP